MIRRVSKIAMAKKSRRVVENWADLILIYLNLKKGGLATLRMKNGLLIKMRNDSTDIQAFASVWLLEEYNKPGFLPEKGIVIDIGAHVGLYSMFVSAASRDTRIFSFEPASDNYALLADNITQNSLHNVEIFNMAVSEQGGSRELFLSEDHAGHALHGKSKRKETVDCVTLDEIISKNNMQEIAVLKLDCEGSEYGILESLSDSGYEKIQRICLEYHTIGDAAALDKLKKNLAGKGFGIEEIHSEGGMGMIFASK